MNVNIAIWGNIGKNPEIKFSKDGSAYTSLSVALPSRRKNASEWEDGVVTWYKILFFGAKAEKVVATFAKGQRVKITGQLLQGAAWTDKEGINRDGRWEIGNAEIELAPLEKKDRTETAPPKANTGNEVVSQPQIPTEAPF